MSEYLSFENHELGLLVATTHSVGAPLRGNAMQLSFFRRSDIRLVMEVLPPLVEIKREDGKPIEVEDNLSTATGTRRVSIFRRPISSLTLRRPSLAEERWIVDRDDNSGVVILAPDSFRHFIDVIAAEAVRKQRQPDARVETAANFALMYAGEQYESD